MSLRKSSILKGSLLIHLCVVNNDGKKNKNYDTFKCIKP
jgi:hypothetical protein